MSLCIGSRIVSSAIWIKHARVGLKEHQNSTSPKDGCYLRSLKKLTSACFIQILRETIYYVLIIYIKMFETIVVLTYVYSVETVLIPSPGKRFPGFVISH